MQFSTQLKMVHGGFSTNTILPMNFDYVSAESRKFYDAFGLLCAIIIIIIIICIIIMLYYCTLNLIIVKKVQFRK